jgi:hypothetical protein
MKRKKYTGRETALEKPGAVQVQGLRLAGRLSRAARAADERGDRENRRAALLAQEKDLTAARAIP